MKFDVLKHWSMIALIESGTTNNAWGGTTTGERVGHTVPPTLKHPRPLN